MATTTRLPPSMTFSAAVGGRRHRRRPAVLRLHTAFAEPSDTDACCTGSARRRDRRRARRRAATAADRGTWSRQPEVVHSRVDRPRCCRPLPTIRYSSSTSRRRPRRARAPPAGRTRRPSSSAAAAPRGRARGDEQRERARVPSRAVPDGAGRGVAGGDQEAQAVRIPLVATAPAASPRRSRPSTRTSCPARPRRPVVEVARLVEAPRVEVVAAAPSARRVEGDLAHHIVSRADDAELEVDEIGAQARQPPDPPPDASARSTRLAGRGPAGRDGRAPARARDGPARESGGRAAQRRRRARQTAQARAAAPRNRRRPSSGRTLGVPRGQDPSASAANPSIRRRCRARHASR